MITALIFAVFGCLYLEQPVDSPDHWKGKYMVTFCVLSLLQATSFIFYLKEYKFFYVDEPKMEDDEEYESDSESDGV